MSPPHPPPLHPPTYLEFCECEAWTSILVYNKFSRLLTCMCMFILAWNLSSQRNSYNNSNCYGAGHRPSDGFLTTRHGGFLPNRFCTDQYKISLKFVCDSDMVWDPFSHDASPHVLVIEQKADPCHVSKFWNRWKFFGTSNWGPKSFWQHFEVIGTSMFAPT